MCELIGLARGTEPLLSINFHVKVAENQNSNGGIEDAF